VKRRAFITLLGGAAAAWPLAARAQQSERVRRIGVFMNTAGDDPAGQARLLAFAQALAQSDWTDGRNVRMDIRWGAGDPSAFADTRRSWLRWSPSPGTSSMSAKPPPTLKRVTLGGVVERVAMQFGARLARSGNHSR